MSGIFDFLHRLLGRDRNTPSTRTATTAHVAPAPLAGVGQSQPTHFVQAAAPAAAAGSTENAVGKSGFICRELILDRQQQIAGHAFDLPRKLRQRLQATHADTETNAATTLQRAYGDALLRSLSQLDLHELLGKRLAFVHLSAAALGHPLIEQLPAQNTVLMLSLADSPPVSAAALQAHIDALRQRGLRHGWLLRKQTLVAQQALLTLASQADHVQFQTADFDGVEIKTLIKLLNDNRPTNLPRLQLTADGLASFDEFNLCFQSGFDFFQGDFISRRDNWHPPKSDINRLLVIKLLNLLRSDTELNLIAPQLTSDPVLSFKLLRYLNSAAMGLQTPVATMDKALVILGRSRFYRWLSLLLFDVKAPGYRERVLIEQALTRAFFLETLAGQGQLPRDGDELFLLGLFSMLDLLIGQPLISILDQAHLPQPVHEALLGKSGPYRNALNLAIAAEAPHADDLEASSRVCGLDARCVTQGSIAALAKAREIAALSEH
ncbi:MAG: HDOD domain-containing protein [Sterolibacterium sp.]|nr:HDOD domain-containing protein [Sterolibacterium sp.]